MFTNKTALCLAALLSLLLIANSAAAISLSGDQKNPAVNRALTGSFFQIYTVNDWDAATFASKFTALKKLGMDHVIWQWTADSLNKKTYYPTKMPGWQNETGRDLVGISLAAAKAAGLKVWLGLNWTDDWWNHYASNKTWLQNEFSIGQKVCQELWNRYHSEYADTIAGFYITMEVDNVNYDNNADQQNMADVYTTLAKYVHKQTGKPVMAAPFFNNSCGMNAAQFADYWGKILQKAPIDIIALQDGVGVHHAVPSNVGIWYQKLQEKIGAVRPATRLWSDLETFDEVTDGDYQPAKPERIAEQIAAEQPYVEKFTTYAWLEYQMQ